MTKKDPHFQEVVKMPIGLHDHLLKTPQRVQKLRRNFVVFATALFVIVVSHALLYAYHEQVITENATHEAYSYLNEPISYK
ncbi:MAG: hypothetical protein RLZZ301_668 [Bacteroidota bacterium]|jgi:hypothetical protein